MMRRFSSITFTGITRCEVASGMLRLAFMFSAMRAAAPRTVTLLGDVTRPVLKSDAGNVVKRLPGVTNVVNDIKVLPLSPFDNRIRVATYRSVFGYAGLYRYAMGTNPSIRIIVDNGHVTLKGVVANQGDKNLAYIRANGVPGVFSVTNDLVVAGNS
jgi:hyperosmotically inducible protein